VLRYASDDTTDALDVAERIRAAIDERGFDIGTGSPLHATASFGVATGAGPDDDGLLARFKTRRQRLAQTQQGDNPDRSHHMASFSRLQHRPHHRTDVSTYQPSSGRATGPRAPRLTFSVFDCCTMQASAS